MGFCQVYSVGDSYSRTSLLSMKAPVINRAILSFIDGNIKVMYPQVWVRITCIIYKMNIPRPLVFFIVIGLSIIFLAACNHGSPVSTSNSPAVVTTESATVTPEPSQTPIPPTPTPTPIPLAAIVNGETITLDEFLGELTRFQAASPVTGTNLASDPSTIVLDELINQTLLAQSAAQNGFIVDETMLQSRIDSLESQLGGSQALEEWKTNHGYSNEDLEKALKRSVGAAWMRDQIMATVPETADEVHVKQILLPTATQADEVYASLQSGSDFLELATSYDPTTGGELGWFPRGYLDDPAIEEAAFALQPGQYSRVVETEIGYHILYLVERDASHTLQPDARRALQVNALQDWINEQRNQSEIQVLLP
jgi:peptidyl-prolyl cis-trans isomerase C